MHAQANRTILKEWQDRKRGDYRISRVHGGMVDKKKKIEGEEESRKSEEEDGEEDH